MGAPSLAQDAHTRTDLHARGREAEGRGPSRHVPKEDTMSTTTQTDVSEAMDTAYRAELERRPRAIEAAKQRFLARVNPAALLDDSDASEGALAAVAASLTEYLLFEADIDGERGALGSYAREEGADEAVASICREAAHSAFFSKFAVVTQDADTGMSTLVDLADGTEYAVLDADVASIERWARGTLGVWLSKVSGQWLCLSVIPFHDCAYEPELDPAEFDYLTLVSRVLGAGGRYANSVRLTANAA